MSWKHAYMIEKSKGRVRMMCTPCGRSSKWQSDDLEGNVRMQEWVKTHSHHVDKIVDKMRKGLE